MELCSRRVTALCIADFYKSSSALKNNPLLFRHSTSTRHDTPLPQDWRTLTPHQRRKFLCSVERFSRISIEIRNSDASVTEKIIDFGEYQAASELVESTKNRELRNAAIGEDIISFYLQALAKSIMKMREIEGVQIYRPAFRKIYLFSGYTLPLFALKITRKCDYCANCVDNVSWMFSSSSSSSCITDSDTLLHTMAYKNLESIKLVPPTKYVDPTLYFQTLLGLKCEKCHSSPYLFVSPFASFVLPSKCVQCKTLDPGRAQGSWSRTAQRAFESTKLSPTLCTSCLNPKNNCSDAAWGGIHAVPSRNVSDCLPLHLQGVCLAATSYNTNSNYLYDASDSLVQVPSNIRGYEAHEGLLVCYSGI